MTESGQKEKVLVNPGEGVNSPKRARFQIWERDENGGVHKERSLDSALYNLTTEYAAFLSVRMPEGGWLHVELDENEPGNVYVTRTSVNTATRTHYTRAMRFFETRHMALSEFKKMLKDLKGEKMSELTKATSEEEEEKND